MNIYPLQLLILESANKNRYCGSIKLQNCTTGGCNFDSATCFFDIIFATTKKIKHMLKLFTNIASTVFKFLVLRLQFSQTTLTIIAIYSDYFLRELLLTIMFSTINKVSVLFLITNWYLVLNHESCYTLKHHYHSKIENRLSASFSMIERLLPRWKNNELNSFK